MNHRVYFCLCAYMLPSIIFLVWKMSLYFKFSNRIQIWNCLKTKIPSYPTWAESPLPPQPKPLLPSFFLNARGPASSALVPAHKAAQRPPSPSPHSASLTRRPRRSDPSSTFPRPFLCFASRGTEESARDSNPLRLARCRVRLAPPPRSPRPYPYSPPFPPFPARIDGKPSYWNSRPPPWSPPPVTPPPKCLRPP
jgi:hypothetical protein